MIDYAKYETNRTMSQFLTIEDMVSTLKTEKRELLAEVERLQLEMKRIPPMKNLISSLENQVRIQKEIIVDLKVMSRQSELDAERETNKMLTNEVERLQKMVEKMTVRL